MKHSPSEPAWQGSGNYQRLARCMRCTLLLTAVSACTGNPLDADAVADFQAGGLGACTELDDLAHALVATYLSRLGGKWKAVPLHHVRPLSPQNRGDQSYCVGHDTIVRVTHAGVSPVRFVSLLSQETHTDSY